MANNLTAFKAELWSKRLITNLDKVTVMLNLVNRDYEGEIRDFGATVYVRTLGNINTASYTKGATISYQDLAPVREALTIADAQYFAFQVDDLDKAQDDISELDAYTQRAAVGINQTVDAKLLGNYVNAHANNQVTGASAAAITLTTANVDQYLVDAGTRLSKFNVPRQGRWMVVDPDTYALIQRAPEFIRATQLGDQMVQSSQLAASASPGFVGQFRGFDIYESTSVPTDATAKYLLFGTRMFISYAAQISQIEAIRLQSSFGTAIRGLLLHDTAVFAEAAKAGGYIKAVK